MFLHFGMHLVKFAKTLKDCFLKVFPRFARFSRELVYCHPGKEIPFFPFELTLYFLFLFSVMYYSIVMYMDLEAGGSHIRPKTGLKSFAPWS